MASPFWRTLVLGYSNRCTCHAPTKEAFATGGHEVEGSFRWYGMRPLAHHAGEIMVAATVDMLEDLYPAGKM